MQQKLGLSRKQTADVATLHRHWHGSKSIEANLNVKLQQEDSSLQEFYAVTQLRLQVNQSTSEDRAVVYCQNPSALINHVLLSRNASSDTPAVVKLGIDGGGSFLKVCVNIVRCDADDPERRMKGACSTRFQDSGVKKLLILAIVENVIENYDNLKAVMSLLDLESVSFVCAVDM